MRALRNCAWALLSDGMGRRGLLLCAVAISLALAGCGGATRVYPARVQSWFHAACRRLVGQRPVPCGCALSYIESHATLSSFESYSDTC